MACVLFDFGKLRPEKFISKKLQILYKCQILIYGHIMDTRLPQFAHVASNCPPPLTS